MPKTPTPAGCVVRALAALLVVALLGGCATRVTGKSRPPAPAPVPQRRATSALAVAVRPSPPESGPDELMAALVLFRYWRQESDKVKAHLDDISDRSRLFGDLTRHYRSLFEEMEQVQREGLDLLAREERDGAFARLDALWMALPVATLQLNYVVLASHAENGGMVTTQWMGMLADMSRRTAPVLQAALGSGFDRRGMEVAARRHQADLEELERNLPRTQEALARGQLWTRRGLFVADGVTLAIVAYGAIGQLQGGVGGGGPRLPVRFPGLAGAGGAAAGVVVLPVEVLESLRELVRLGAISAATLATGLTLMVGKPEAVGGRAPPAPAGQSSSGGDTPDPRIDGSERLNHTWKHSAQWFGKEVPRATHFKIWQSLLRRAARSSQVFEWTSYGEPTTAHLARIEGKWFVVQFFKGGRLAGQLATAFVPNQAELGAMLQRLGH